MQTALRLRGADGKPNVVTTAIALLVVFLVAQHLSQWPISRCRYPTHMREQPMWGGRSIYHISSRYRDLIYSDRKTLRGKIILPCMLINGMPRGILALPEYLTLRLLDPYFTLESMLSILK